MSLRSRKIIHDTPTDDRSDDAGDKAGFVIAFGAVALSGLAMGLLFGWLIWG